SPPTTLEARLRTSVAWYSRLGFKRVMEADDPSAILGGTGRSWLIERVSERQDGSVSLRALLRTNREVVQRIVNLKPVVAYIAGTGSGKRLAAFLLPACCPGFSQQVVDAGYVERIVLDDFYYVSLPDYKYQMMHGLVRFGIPITLLSATVPVNKEREAYQLLRVHGPVQAIRQLTSQGNLRYEVKELRYSSTLSSMASYVRQQHRTWQKVLVYVLTAGTATLLSEALSALLIATVGSVAGVDMPGISCILWFRVPNHPITFAQGTGRGGRKGETCLARIVHGPGLPIFRSGFGDPTARRVMDQVSACDGCLRIPIDAYLNGNSKRTACRFGEELCTFC
ncbi:hypothetical protein K504DRAFT_468352, partial [Pleomassaria siparia CBS 279.74]